MNDGQAVKRSSSGDGSAQVKREQASGDAGYARGKRELTAAGAGLAAMELMGDLAGKDAEGVTGVEPVQDGWVVTVEVVEDRGIPSSTDVLAAFEVELALDGDVVSYRRVRRYPRGRGDSEDA